MAQRQRNNWGLRSAAIAGSLAAFVAFWQLAAHYPHPPGAPGSAALQPTPTTNYTLPTGGSTFPLPAPPHSGTGLSH